MSQVKLLLQANQSYSNRFVQQGLPMPPARKVAVLTCMDARIDPLPALGADLGDIHVIRNAGGRVTADAVRSFVISQQLLGTQEILVLHHTDCGMLTFANQDLRQKIRENLGSQAGDEALEIDFLPFTDLEKSVREDIEVLRRSPLIPQNVPIHGAIYDVNTGEVRTIG